MFDFTSEYVIIKYNYLLEFKVYQLSNFKMVNQIPTNHHEYKYLKVLPDDQTVLCIDEERSIHFYDLSGSEVNIENLFQFPFYLVIPDFKYNGMVQLVSLPSRTIILNFYAHLDQQIYSFTNDDNIIYFP